MLDIYSRPEVWQWLGVPPTPTRTLNDVRVRLARWQRLSSGDPTYGVWAVQETGGGVVGTVMLVPLRDGAGEIEVGWHLHPDAWGRGYATEAGRGALERGFAAGLEEVFAVISPGNHRSAAVAGRLGMAGLGVTERFYGGEPLWLFRATPAG